MKEATKEGEGYTITLFVDMIEYAGISHYGSSAMGEGAGTRPLTGDDDPSLFVNIPPLAICVLHRSQLLTERIDELPHAGNDQGTSLIDETILPQVIPDPRTTAMETTGIAPLAGNDDIPRLIGKADKAILLDRLQFHLYEVNQSVFFTLPPELSALIAVRARRRSAGRWGSVRRGNGACPPR